jgi:3-hydroxybutyryl-CoA dehydrogenase
LSFRGKVAVIGSGVMGHGIAIACALGGYEVNMVDTTKEILARASDRINADFTGLVKMGFVTDEGAKSALARITTTTTIADAVRGSKLVTEAITEQIASKKELFKDLDQRCPEDVVLASNTASFRITEIASAVSKKNRVVGTHWWNPPYLMPLVEITKGAETSEATANKARQFLLDLGKAPVLSKDHPGLIGVRLHAALNNEAVRILQEGLASAEDIDTTVRMSIGLRWGIVGPLETLDLGGLDVFDDTYEHLGAELGERFRPPALLKEKVAKGELGVKTKKGFYQYTPESIESLLKRRDEFLAKRVKEMHHNADS